MWRSPFGHRMLRLAAVVGVLLALGLAVVAMPVATALAAPPPTVQATEPAAAGQPESQYPRLERLYRTEQRVLERQEQRLERAGKVAERLEAFIESQKDKGRDVSQLEDALAKFAEAREAAKGDLDTAREILSAHGGFDDHGNVTDPAQARETVREAGKAERSFRQTMRQAYHQLLIAVKQFRHANAPAAD